jgi:hypothetical protein
MSTNILPSGFRPAFISGITTLRVETTGNDSTGNGSVAFPFATIGAAIAAAPWNQTVTIQLGAGSFAAPYISSGSISVFANFANTVIRGTTTAGAVATIAAVGATAITSEMVLDVTGLTASADDYRGERFIFGSGPANARVFWCTRNSATGAFAPGETRLYGIQVTSTTINVPLVGNTLTHQTLSEVTGTTISCNSSTNFQDVSINVTGAITALTGRFSTFGCRIRCARVQTQQPDYGGAVAFRTSYYQPTSTTLPAGFFAAGAVRFSGGNVIDLGDAGAGLNTLVFEGAKFYTSNQVLFRDVLEIQLNGSQVLGADLSTIGAYTANDPWVFESQGAISCEDGVQLNKQPAGYGGEYSLPPMHGAINGDYIVGAKKGAVVNSIIAGSVTTALGINAVSADGGATECSSAPDGTVIMGLSRVAAAPVRTVGFGPMQPVSVAGPATIAAQSGSFYVCDTSAGIVTLNFPTGVVGSVIGVKNKIAGFNLVASGGAANIENIASLGTYGASTLVNGVGNCAYFVFDGTDWVYSY